MHLPGGSKDKLNLTFKRKEATTVLQSVTKARMLRLTRRTLSSSSS